MRSERAKGVAARKRGGDKDKVTAYLPLDLGGRFRTACAQMRMDLSEAVAQAISKWLKATQK